MPPRHPQLLHASTSPPRSCFQCRILYVFVIIPAITQRSQLRLEIRIILVIHNATYVLRAEQKLLFGTLSQYRYIFWIVSPTADLSTKVIQISVNRRENIKPVQHYRIFIKGTLTVLQYPFPYWIWSLLLDSHLKTVLKIIVIFDDSPIKLSRVQQS